MTRMTRWLPPLLIAGLLTICVLAVLAKDGEPATMITGRVVLEPRGPKPKILFPPPRDFENLKGLRQTEARQLVALAKYRMVFRSYLRWRTKEFGSGSRVVLQPVRFRCKATNILMPSNWCWYAKAARWTERELAQTEVAIELERRTIHLTNDWVTAVRIVQRVYPGTEQWLLGCSDAEGGHGRWVWFGGRSWSGGHVGNDYLGMDTVGGWMQFRWSTFKPYWFGYWGAHGALADTRARGFIVPELGSGYGPWLSPIGQALTAAYMRYTGRDGHHWSASHGNGC